VTVEQLLEQYQAEPKNIQLADALKQDNARVQLRNVTGSAGSFIAAAVHKTLSKPFLIILSDKEEAAYFLNDLENLLGEDSVLFFPSSYRRPYEIEDVDNANILLRAEVLNRINKDNKPIFIVSYPEALTEKVVTKTHLSKNTLEVRQDEKISIEFIADVLTEYGFKRIDYVIEPGQFSVRGGIVDVFSFSNDYPYRIEFFGDDVDSIRSFDPITQLSVSKLVKATIIPNVQDKLLLEQRQTFLQYIPSNTALWFKDYQLTLDKMGKEFDNAVKAFGKLAASVINHLQPDEMYVSGETFAKQSLDFPLVEFGNRFYLQPTLTLTYNFAPQPTFNKNFDLLTKDLDSNMKTGITNIIFSDTSKQIERLYAIFEDIIPGFNPNDSKVFTPILLSIHEGFIDRDLKLACYTDHQVFERYHRFRLKNSGYKKNEAITIKELKGLNPGDYVTHIDHGIGRFGGLEKIEVNGKMQEAIRLVYKDNDVLYISITSLHRIAKYSGKEGSAPRIDKLGSNAWANLKQKTKKKVKELAFDLIKLYAQRKSMKGFQYSRDTYLQNELEASFIYEDTPDQLKATVDVKKDMEQASPMDRLVCGDVGFGKTEVAVRAAFKAATDGKQVAVLVPTTILALQHYKTFKDRLSAFPCTVDYINRFKSPKEQKETLAKLAAGKIDIIIGTHKLASKDVKFKDLGLLIIDEEQKFGVAVKDKLKTLKTTVDTLTLTATPIPRTLQFSMLGARDLSVINTPPPNRYPVHTELHTFNEETIRDAVQYELSRGGQVFFVHNRVQSIMEVAGMIQRLVPGSRVLVGHGQMDGEKLEKVMLDFIEGDYDVLVATTIIESGLDIPNANTILINDAHMFGLSDLHQMRGRVGRSNKKSFCYLLTPPVAMLTSEARKRLKAIEEFSDLGSGFNIAMRDLDIRGAGNLLGGEQSGFITDIGYDMYMKILDEAVQELKDNEFKDVFLTQEEQRNPGQPAPAAKYVKDCQVDTDLQILIPDDYVSNSTERLSLYRDLDNSRHDQDLIDFELELRDRFGPVPPEVRSLINTVRLRWLAMDIGFEKLVLKNDRLIGYFITNQESPYYQSDTFTKVLQFVQFNQRICKMKENNKKLTLSFDSIRTVEDAIAALSRILPAASSAA
jgi:transcription-repair coupling factor (superfamily II helicase)